MENTWKNKELEDIKKIKNFLSNLGFICDSSSSSQNLVYSKDGEVILIKNRKNDRGV